MDIKEAIDIAREVEAKEDRCNGAQRGKIVHIAFETLIAFAENNLPIEAK